MQELFLYLLKSSGLIAAFFLSYHFLLRKETFFTSNRWFLLAGLITSVTLPLYFIKRIVFVERPKFVTDNLASVAQESNVNATTTLPTTIEAINWMQLLYVGYVVVVLLLLIKVLFNGISLFKLLHNKKIEKQETFAIVDLKENIAPFSFFNFIVFNSSLYTPSEMESILLHEKVHSQQKHSYDVLIAKFFCVLFWFNPFVWLYKKAIVQNLEYIADSKAVQLIEDKKVYQKALLKVVTHQNCLSITNPFYQSLIKKRIVMLNKNQSHKRNSWKYIVVIPALIAFIVLFQVKIIAQEMAATSTESTTDLDAIYVTTNKNSTDADMKKSTELLKGYGIKLKFSKVKRNAKGEITGIKVEFKDKNGNSGVTQFNSNTPIKPIHFYKTNDKIGFGKRTEYKVYTRGGNEDEEFTIAFPNPMSAPDPMETPEPMESPEPVEAPEPIEIPEPMEALEPLEIISGSGSNTHSRVVIKNDNEEPIVIENGKVVKGGGKLSKKELENALKEGYAYNFSSGNNRISQEEIIRIQSDAMKNARISINKMRPEIMARAKQSMEKARIEMEKMGPQMERARVAMERSRPDMEKAKAEMQEAKAEMMKAKAEMDQLRAELEKERANLKSKK